MKTVLISLLSFLLLTTAPLSSDLEKIGLAIQTGNSKELAKYFDNTVEITLLEKEETYSKAQAEMVLKDFFTRNKPASFKLMHNGNSGPNLIYGIGTLVTNKGNFRVTFFMKQLGATFFIQEIRFEND